ncbi:hypothetical protein [Mucilaginibacter agri]|uniref:Uncharacterized protein n=1 Tax=Mucilaginibacter agri TaxID=2695265 RepID=A0A965ZI59_9SPHI|nr:hypothetical protein [Mucilaginibacter agri]NCD70086.1 hypothetical protein [Mucilaginibacter agri]
MKDLNDVAFIRLFKEACQKCFGYPLTAPLSETESKHLGNQILEATGLVIGAKSLKNYSIHVVSDGLTRTENPSVATLDTLARYVLNAPYTNEIRRKDQEGHFPFWFQYKGGFAIPSEKVRQKRPFPIKNLLIISGIIIFVAVGMLLMIHTFHKASAVFYKDNFHVVNESVLTKDGWIIKDKDTTWWAKRSKKIGQLTLYTLRGDNWADSANKPAIKNLLIRKLTSDCFVTEIHLENFVPLQNWQQAGILLLEDSTLNSKSMRMSIAYNDYFGGYHKPNEIIIQAITSNSDDLTKPEEIVHLPVLAFEKGKTELVARNMLQSALKIIKNGNHFRLLYSAGARNNFAYKEALSKDLDFEPKYVGIFALQGFVDKPQPIPAPFKFFSVTDIPCN